MGKVIVWPTDFFTILSEKWNLSIFSLKSCFQYAYMLGCPFSSTSYWTCINIFFLKNPFVQFTIFWRWIHQMNGNLNTSYVDFLVMLCWPPMDKGSFPRSVLLPSQELRFRSISWDKSGSNMSCLSIQSILSRLNEQIFIIYPEFRTGYIFSKERTFSNKSAINMPQIQTYLLNASWCMSNKL